ncbi:hypothetical protein DPEC_G00068560, partial [Dallia pectoralis]
ATSAAGLKKCGRHLNAVKLLVGSSRRYSSFNRRTIAGWARGLPFTTHQQSHADLNKMPLPATATKEIQVQLHAQFQPSSDWSRAHQGNTTQSLQVQHPGKTRQMFQVQHPGNAKP